MQGVERSYIRFLDQLLGVPEDMLAHFHEFPIGSILAQPRTDGEKIPQRKFTTCPRRLSADRASTGATAEERNRNR